MTTLTLVERAVRRDKRGRRIGYNWWRDYVMDAYSAADRAWMHLRESHRPIGTTDVAGADFETGYYQLSDAEYAAINPRPTLKAFLIELAGINTQPDEQDAA